MWKFLLKPSPENNSLCLRQGRRCEGSFCTGKGSLGYPVCVTNSVKDRQRVFRVRYRKDSPQNTPFYIWCRQFGSRGYVCKGENEDFSRFCVPCLKDAFQRSARQAAGRGSCETNSPPITVWCVLRKRSLLKSYKFQLRQLFKPSDKTSDTNSLSLSKRRGSTACCQCRQWQSEAPQPSCLGISKSSPILRAWRFDRVNVLKNMTFFFS